MMKADAFEMSARLGIWTYGVEGWIPLCGSKRAGPVETLVSKVFVEPKSEAQGGQDELQS